MLNKDIQLIPAPIDGWFCKGQVIRWFKTGNYKTKFDFSWYSFGSATGAEEGMAMCSFAMEDTTLCGIFYKANQK
eukprot:4273243-Ditylum_brightwellii.AAC.1